MNDELIDVRTPLAVSENVRIELGTDGALHVVTPQLTLHLDRARCEELTTTLARGLVRLHKLEVPRARPNLRVISADETADRSVPRPRAAQASTRNS